MALAFEPTVLVEGAVCPTADEVQAELGRLSGHERQAPGTAPAREAGTDVASVRVVAGRLHVELRRADGSLMGEKDLELSTRCGELARAVAVVITAWESQLRFDVAAPPPPPAPPPEPASPPKAPAPPPAAQVLPPAAAAGDAGSKASWGIELGLGASLKMPATRPGAELFMAARHPASPWLGHLVLDASTWQTAALGGGTGRWMRAFAGLGGGYAWRGARLTAQLEAQVLGAATIASADGFGVGWAVQRQTAFAPGLGAGFRVLGPRRSSVGAWAAVESAFWPRSQSLRATDQTGGVVNRLDLPRFELWLAAGGILPGPL